MKKYKSIDLFGGICLGFEQAFGNQIETNFISEFDKFAIQTYKANFEKILKITRFYYA